MAERLQAIEGQLNEIKTMLVQMKANAGGAPIASSGEPRPPRTRRPPTPQQSPSQPPGEKT
jgi:hypothetical protein